jgi:ABC-type multidrug transport system ATPase subunit/ABC-type multidrug transport system permease subunit
MDAAVLYEGRRSPVGAEGLTLGRGADCDIPLSTERASRRHARIRIDPDGEYRLEDLGSTHGTFLNGVRLGEDARALASGDTITIAGEPLRFAVGQATQFGGSLVDAEPDEPEPDDRIELAGVTTLTIGRDAQNDVVLGSAAVSRFHAEVHVEDDRLAVRDLGSTNGTRVDGRLVASGILEGGGAIGIGPYRLVYDGTALVRRDDRGRVRLDAERLTIRVEEKTILDNATLSIPPGELVVIIGESGSGKSTLIKALAGVHSPTEGTVSVSGEPIESRLADIGYVPQDDIVHGLLTVREALSYSARLRLPEDASDADVRAAVERALGEVALEEHGDTRIDALSGGQRKRAGVAVELLTEPGLLFLDEPTTGLDPALESRLMRLLRELADAGRSVTVITHATKNLRLCDRLVVMGRGGVMAFQGTPDEAIRFFGVESYDDVYEALEAHPAEEWRRRSEAGTERAVEGAPPVARGARRPARRGAGRQTLVLARRYLKLMARDRRNLMILLGQVPILALFAAGLFKANVFSHGREHAQNTTDLLFLFVMTTLWIGSIDAAREIVKERSITLRERAAGLRLGAYLGSKLMVLCTLAALQALVLAGLVLLLRPLHEPPSAYVGCLAVLVATAIAAVGMGLLLSAVVRTEDQATSLIPLALIPQLFFAGSLAPPERMGEPVATLSSVIFAQWSLRGEGTAVGMKDRIGADPRFVNAFGDHFFNVQAGVAVLVLLGFFALFMLGVVLLMRRAEAGRASR